MFQTNNQFLVFFQPINHPAIGGPPVSQGAAGTLHSRQRPRRCRPQSKWPPPIARKNAAVEKSWENSWKFHEKCHGKFMGNWENSWENNNIYTHNEIGWHMLAVFMILSSKNLAKQYFARSKPVLFSSFSGLKPGLGPWDGDVNQWIAKDVVKPNKHHGLNGIKYLIYLNIYK